MVARSTAFAAAQVPPSQLLQLALITKAESDELVANGEADAKNKDQGEFETDIGPDLWLARIQDSRPFPG